MTSAPLLYPMASMVLLTFAVLVWLFHSRVPAVVSGRMRASYFKIYQGAEEPEQSLKLARHFTNLFETPTLFYLACASGMALRSSNTLLLSLAWVFVGLRVAHAVIHTGANRLRPRIVVCFASWLVLLGMWATLLVSP